ncbi:hypothetical protein D0Z66_03800 [Cereibacter sphaeroides]|nr:hypothetical protein D0Z66_03800 [Cereibacter sphaeroides]MBO4169298.1 hypothetical protein [Cereibacter azotoformans]
MAGKWICCRSSAPPPPG